MSIILGIDPGSIKTGYGVIQTDGRHHNYIDCGYISLGSGPLPGRLNELFENLNELINLYKPQCVSVEQVFVAKNARSALTLGHARGVIIVAAVQQKMSVYEYSAKQIKSSVVGNGAATKQQVQFMVKNLLQLPSLPQEDAADALAAALCHISRQSIISEHNTIGNRL
jgi:crossover junction endodeoxyribonuclease RuvC